MMNLMTVVTGVIGFQYPYIGISIALARPYLQIFQKYEYWPIDSTQQIRLLKRTYNAAKDGYIYEFIHVHAKDLSELNYIALSYMWQPHRYSTSTSSFYVRGGKTPGQACHPVSENLQDFLKAYSSLPDEENLIYIDALCINQTSSTEKEYQIRLMHDVYSHAKKTIVWLGAKKQNLDPVRNHQLNDLYQSLYNHRSPQYASYENSVRHMCNQQYWERLWIVQECLLSGDTEIWYDAHHRFRWKDIDALVQRYGIGVAADTEWTSYERKARALFDAKRALTSLPYLSQATAIPPALEHSMTMMQTISRFGLQKCSNRKDKIYGLLGLVGRHDITVRYDDEWPVTAIALEVMHHVKREIFRDDAIVPAEKTPRFDDFAKFLLDDCQALTGAERKILSLPVIVHAAVSIECPPPPPPPPPPLVLPCSRSES